MFYELFTTIMFKVLRMNRVIALLNSQRHGRVDKTRDYAVGVREFKSQHWAAYLLVAAISAMSVKT